MTNAREVIASTVIGELHSVLGDVKHQLRMTETGADAIIAALKAAGLVIVPVEPTEGVLRAYYQCMIGTHPKAEMNPDKYLVHNLKAKKRWRAMVEAASVE